jgi:catechol 2,3-dioxygenase-like lactoylglutathione lyase family enzyme
MLGTQDAVATVAVKNLAAAQKFYEGALGLKPIDAEGEEVVVYQSGNSRLNVYRSKYAGTNKATAVTWAVENVEAEVDALKARGVAFEH